MITYFFRFFEQLVHDGRVYAVGQCVAPVSDFSGERLEARNPLG
jgi:hypothetical protein